MDHEDDVKKELKQANQRLTELEQLKFLHIEGYKTYQRQIEVQMASGMKGHAVSQINSYQMYFRDQIEQDELEIRFQERQIDMVKERLAEAMKERKIMEKLKEKALERHREEQKMLENKETDEIVNFQNTKKSGD